MVTRREPKWLARKFVEAMHDNMLEQHGGLQGLRDVGALESALGRPMHRWHYSEANELADSAASYGFGIARNLPFADGNKRTAFVAMASFYTWNGGELLADEAEMVHIMVGVAEGSVSETELAAWLRKNTPKPRRKRAR